MQSQALICLARILKCIGTPHITQALAFVLGLQQAQLCAVALAGCGVL